MYVRPQTNRRSSPALRHRSPVNIFFVCSFFSSLARARAHTRIQQDYATKSSSTTGLGTSPTWAKSTRKQKTQPLHHTTKCYFYRKRRKEKSACVHFQTRVTDPYWCAPPGLLKKKCFNNKIFFIFLKKMKGTVWRMGDIGEDETVTTLTSPLQCLASLGCVCVCLCVSVCVRPY